MEHNLHAYIFNLYNQNVSCLCNHLYVAMPGYYKCPLHTLRYTVQLYTLTILKPPCNVEYFKLYYI